MASATNRLGLKRPESAAFRRARRPDQKEDRRQAILDMAQDELAASSFSQLTMAKLAQKVGLAKGTLYLYFETKEELLLALVENLLATWFSEIRAKLDKAKSKPEALARMTAASLLKQEALGRLLPIAISVTGQNASQPWVADYRNRVLNHCRRAGKSLESRAAGLAPGGGVRFLLYAFALVSGLSQFGVVTFKPNKSSSLPRDPKSQRSSFEREFMASLEIMMRGLITA